MKNPLVPLYSGDLQNFVDIEISSQMKNKHLYQL